MANGKHALPCPTVVSIVFALENLVLRQQLAVLKHRYPRPRLRDGDRLFWVLLSRVWSGWRECPYIVQPETVVRGIARDFATTGVAEREPWAAKDRPRNPRLGPAHVWGQPAVGRAADPRRAVEALDEVPRFLLRDRDGICGTAFRRQVAALEMVDIMTAPRSPWQKGFLSRHARVNNLFRYGRHLLRVANHRLFRASAFKAWRQVTCT